MKAETKKKLKQTRSNLGKCAAKVVSRKSSTQPQIGSESEMIIGFGTARDWIRWAYSLSDLKFSTTSEQTSARAQGIVESVRFNQIWTATNALFAKDSILAVSSSPVPLSASVKSSEIERFKVIYKIAALDPLLEKSCVDTLNKLLSMECKATGITGVLTADGTPTMWEVIYHKYMRPEDRKRSLGKAIALALTNAQNANALATTAGNKLTIQPTPVVDGHVLIYAARNWAVHGMLLTSFFRGSREKYITFIDNISLLLSAVLEGASRNLLLKI